MDLLKAKKYTTVTHRSEMNGGFFYTPCQMTCLSIMFRAEGSTRKRHYGHVILTLAHCLKNFPASVYLFSVLHDDGTLSYTNIVRKFAHSQARQDSSDAFDPNDVALAVINPPILDRRPIMIADTALSQFPQKMLTVGFGVTGRGDKDFFIEDRRGRAMESIVREPTDALLKGKAILVEFIRQNPDKLLAGLPHYGDCGAPGIINNQVVGLALHQEELDRHTKKWSQAKNVVLPGQTGAYAHQVPAGSLKITDAVRVDVQGNAYFDSLIADAESQVHGQVSYHFPRVHHFYDQYHSYYINLGQHMAWIKSVAQNNIGRYIDSHRWLYPGETPTRIPNEHKSKWSREESPSDKEKPSAIAEENDRCWLQYYSQVSLRLCWDKEGKIIINPVTYYGLVENNAEFSLAHPELMSTGKRYKGDL